MFKNVTVSKQGSFVPLGMEPYRIPKLKETTIDFFSEKSSGNKLNKLSEKKLDNGKNNLLSELKQDRVKRDFEIGRLQRLQESSLKVEEDIKKITDIENSKVIFKYFKLLLA